MPDELFRLRSDWNATLQTAAEQLDLDVVAVEKDYWVCQVLRGIASGPRADTLVFKGGTSLEKLRLTQRFSEDIDALVIVPEGLSKNAHAKHLKLLATDALVEGVTESSVQVSGGSPGSFHRNAWLRYREAPITGATGLVDEGVILLELGESGGPSPEVQADVTSLVGRQLDDSAVPVHDFVDLCPFSMRFLHPGRTLLEKLLRVEAFIMAPNEVRDPETEWKRIGRQFYDIWALLGDEGVRTLLQDTQQVAEILASAGLISQAFTTAAVARPAAGFATSIAYDPAAAWAPRLRQEHDRAMAAFYYGNTPAPSFDQVCTRVGESADLL